ncbi:rab-GTPase-TBC domain-containing protein, partial [Piptocephalis cylindrospora]
QIDMDVERTLRANILFRPPYGPGQRAMFHTLRTLSLVDKELGYCQGMSTIAAILLLYFPGDTAYVMMRNLLAQPGFRGLFLPGFPGLLEAFHVQEEILSTFHPRLHAHLKRIDLVTMMYATRWYCTLYAGGCLAFPTVLRIWDVMMLKGPDALIGTAVALLLYHEQALLSSSFEEALTLLNGMMSRVKEETLLSLIHKTMEDKRMSSVMTRAHQSWREKQVVPE